MNALKNPSLKNDEARASALSALVDGELSSEELDAVLATLDEPDEGLQAWSRYQLIGDVLRGTVPGTATGGAAGRVAGGATRSPQDFLAGIQAQLRASAPQVSIQHVPVASAVDRIAQPDAPAANDAVFRWKMVAGVASLAAVMAVSWTLLQNAPATGGQGRGAQLALMPAPGVQASAVSTMGQDRPEPVVVNTAQGPVLRDPQLEALMAQHRRYGDMSALQMPSGFLRNATHDAPAR